MENLSVNVAELIPYKSVQHMINITKQEHRKGRHVEVWDGYIYSAKKWQKC